MAGEIRIGTSGWNYPHWKGTFYPADLRPSAWFAYYCGIFDTVEVNYSFYRQPTDHTYDQWRQAAPSGFRYSVKANRYLTHMCKLRNPEEPLANFLHGARRLENHLGPLLYQLPPNWRPNLERLRDFLDILPSTLQHVVEFRDRRWLSKETYELLVSRGVGICVHDLLARHPRLVTGPTAYLRLHGAGKKYGGRYGKRRLQSWACWLREIATNSDVYVYFNNDELGYAPRDAARLKDLLA